MPEHPYDRLLTEAEAAMHIAFPGSQVVVTCDRDQTDPLVAFTVTRSDGSRRLLTVRYATLEGPSADPMLGLVSSMALEFIKPDPDPPPSGARKSKDLGALVPPGYFTWADVDRLRGPGRADPAAAAELADRLAAILPPRA
ncbi:MAG: hypothetical protein ABI647_26905 [Gemmatimonadota bacterium]